MVGNFHFIMQSIPSISFTLSFSNLKWRGNMSKTRAVLSIRPTGEIKNHKSYSENASSTRECYCCFFKLHCSFSPHKNTFIRWKLRNRRLRSCYLHVESFFQRIFVIPYAIFGEEILKNGKIIVRTTFDASTIENSRHGTTFGSQVSFFSFLIWASSLCFCSMWIFAFVAWSTSLYLEKEKQLRIDA